MWWIQLLVGLALAIIGYIIMPKAKSAKPDSVSEMESPTAESGIPVTVIFGEILMKSPNLLWFGNKYYLEKSSKSKGKK